MPQEWLDDLKPFGTDWHKEFLETVPALIVVLNAIMKQMLMDTNTTIITFLNLLG